MRELTVDEVRAIQLEIVDEIDRVCRACGIEYFLGYGSLLGAIRHGGFIPWDDDMDLLMMRADYERFAEEFPRENAVERFRVASYRDRTAPNAFFKVVDDTTRVEERYADSKYELGVWVDIFPLDEIRPSDMRVLSRVRRAQTARYLMVTDPSSGGSGAVRLAKRVACPLFRRFDPYKCAGRIDAMAHACGRASEAVASDGEKRFVADIVAEPKPNLIYPKSLFAPVEADFEGRRYFVPQGYEAYLTTMYGDWQTPPPETQRETHSSRVWLL